MAGTLLTTGEGALQQLTANNRPHTRICAASEITSYGAFLTSASCLDRSPQFIGRVGRDLGYVQNITEKRLRK